MLCWETCPITTCVLSVTQRARDKRKSRGLFGWFPIGDNRPGKYTRGLAISDKGWLLESGRSPRSTSVEALASVPNRSDFEAFARGFPGLTRSGASSGFPSSDRSSRLALGFSLALKASSISFLTSCKLSAARWIETLTSAYSKHTCK